MRFLHGFGLIVALLAAGFAPAFATTITKTVNFSATGFVPFTPFSAPVNPVTGSFTITFDPTLNYWNDSTHITKNSLNINVAGVSFDYSSVGDSLIIGGQLFGAAPLAPMSDDFALVLGGFLHGPHSHEFLYSQSGSPSLFTATRVNVSAVPLPSSVFLMASALGLLALFGWQRNKRVAKA